MCEIFWCTRQQHLTNKLMSNFQRTFVLKMLVTCREITLQTLDTGFYAIADALWMQLNSCNISR